MVVEVDAAVSLERQLARHQFGERGQLRILEELGVGGAPGLGVERARLAHAAAGHGQLAEQGVREHGEIGRPAGDEPARPAGAVGGRVELGHEPEVAGHAVEEGPAGHAGSGRQGAEADGAGPGPLDVGVGDGERAVHLQDAGGKQPVDLEGGIRARRGCRLQEDALCVPVAAPVVERDRAEERQARAPGDGALGEQPVGGSEAVVAGAQPPLQAAGLEQHGAGEPHVPRLGRVAHGLDGGAAAGERGRDAALQAAGPAGALAAHGLGAVLAQQRMQAVDGRLGGADRLQQSGETGQRRDAVEDAGPLEHLVGEVAVDPVEQGEIEHGFAVRRREGAPETGGDPAANGVAHGRGVRGRRFGGDVAPHPQGNGPAAGLGGDGGEAATRQGEAEEAGDVGAGEAQVVRSEDLGVEQRARGRESGRQRPVGQRDVQVRRRLPEQGVEDRDGVRVGDLFEFVEGEHERRVARLEGAQQHGSSRQRRADRRAVGAERRRQVEAGPLEGEGEVCVERWGVVVCEGQPGHRQTGADGIAAGGGEDGRLAEAAGGGQRRDGPAGGCAARCELRAVAVTVGLRGDGHPLLKQPGRRGWGLFGRPRGGQVPLRGGGPPRRRRTGARARGGGARSAADRSDAELTGVSHVQ